MIHECVVAVLCHKLSALILFVNLLCVGLSVAEDCRCFRGDSCWPTHSTWATFNASIGGRLVATVPLGKSCHDPNYNATACNNL